MLSCVSILNTSKEGREKKFNITYLNDSSNEVIRNLSTHKNNLVLENEKDAYVLNYGTFNNLNEKSVESYLKNGGIIVVSDNSVTSKVLKNKIETSVIDFDYSKELNQYGFYIYNDGENNITVNVGLGFLSKNNKKAQDEVKSVIDYVSEDNIVESIVSKAVSKISLNPNLQFQEDNSTGGGVTSSKGGLIATAYLDNILYLESSNQKACSYSIYTNVYDVAKVKDSNGTIHGLYDVSSSFILDAESKYAITDYSVRMKNVNTIVDASYLNSNTSTCVSLGGSIGFQGDVITGSLESGISYTYTPDSQEISNDLAAGPYKYWKSHVISKTYGTSRKIIPSIRILNNSDYQSTSEYSRVESFNLKDDGWWIFQNNYYMKDEYRKELAITWNSLGFISQTTIIG